MNLEQNIEQVLTEDSVNEKKEQVVNEDNGEEKQEVASPDVEVEEMKSSTKDDITMIEINNLKDDLNTHYAQIKNLLRINKEKDLNVVKLNNILQKYREGFDDNLYKSVALNLINFREDCSRSLREFATKELSLNDATKYLKYIIYDLEDLLDNLGISSSNDEWLYYGKPLNDVEKITRLDEPLPIEINEIVDENITTAQALVNYIQKSEVEIASILKNNSILDKLLTEYISQSQMYEKGIEKVVLYPVIKKIIKLYESSKREVEEVMKNLTEENCKISYLEQLVIVKEKTEDIFVLCNVTIDGFVSDSFDPKKHRILKTIATDDDKLNGVVESRLSECYMLGEKVIYPQKVVVYKKLLN